MKPGKRGVGRPKGKASLDKEAARELVRQRVYRDLTPLLDAQIANAKGINFLIIRDKRTGKFLRVAKEVAEKHNTESEELIEVWEKDPSVQAFTDLMNRALDKPKEQEQEITLSGSLDLVASRLVAARKRLAAK